MWRNGRRNGLKIRWAVKGPCRFESGHRHPPKAILRVKTAQICNRRGCEWSRIETHEITVYSPTIRQVAETLSVAGSGYRLLPMAMAGAWDSQSNPSMKPTAPLRNKSNVFATTPCRGLSLSR